MKSTRSLSLAALTVLVTCSLSGTALAGKPEKVYYGGVFLEAGFLLVDLNIGEAILNRGPSDLVDGNSELLCSLLAS